MGLLTLPFLTQLDSRAAITAADQDILRFFDENSSVGP